MMLRELLAGAGAFLRGLRTWSRNPRLMLIGAIPALLVGLVVVAGFILVLTRLPAIVGALTPFSEDWGEPARTLVRVGAGAAVVIALVLIAVSTFTALTLAVGDVFYERIWLAVERDLGGFTPEEAGFWSSLRGAIATAVHLLGQSLLLGALLFLVGLLPVVGSVSALVVGAVLGGRLLAAELLDRPLTGRGMSGEAQTRLRRARRARVTGFGACAYLLFLLPLGAVIAMPAAVAGATFLARDLLPSDAPDADGTAPTPIAADDGLPGPR